VAEVQQAAPARPVIRARVRSCLGFVLTAVAFVVVWAALVAPNRLSALHPVDFVRLPLEGLMLVVVSVVLPLRPRRIVAAASGFVLGLLVILKILDIGFYEGLDRPFNVLLDWTNFTPAIGVLRDSVGTRWVHIIVASVLVGSVTTVVLVTLSAVRVADAVARHRSPAARLTGSAAVAWIACAASAAQLVSGSPLASASDFALGAGEVVSVHDTLHDEQIFARSLVARDAARRIPARNLLSGLRGKDVIFAFVESYGEVAVQGTSYSDGVDGVLRAGTASLAAAGFGARSAFLTSPTFGGISWLAHSTLQSGLWIDSQQRYDELMSSHRFTLSDAFDRAGWRTVSDIPSDAGAWPQGRTFYHYGSLYNASNVGYHGPRFSYARIPDQWSMQAFRRLELTPHHAPLMTEIDLVSSHTPWTPLPHMLPWRSLGNGSVYRGMPRAGQPPSVVWRSAARVQEMYGRSIQYSIRSLVSFVTRSRDRNLVLVMLGDHQPATIVSGENASHDVPISIVARDPSVLHRISSWGWQSGLLPRPDAPDWPMSAFRNKFLTAFSSPIFPARIPTGHMLSPPPPRIAGWLPIFETESANHPAFPGSGSRSRRGQTSRPPLPAVPAP
jgi:hypothetical protein